MVVGHFVWPTQMKWKPQINCAILGSVKIFHYIIVLTFLTVKTKYFKI